MLSVSSRIWTCGAVSISYDDNHYTTGTSLLDFIMIRITCVGIAYVESIKLYMNEFGLV